MIKSLNFHPRGLLQTALLEISTKKFEYSMEIALKSISFDFAIVLLPYILFYAFVFTLIALREVTKKKRYVDYVDMTIFVVDQDRLPKNMPPFVEQFSDKSALKTKKVNSNFCRRLYKFVTFRVDKFIWSLFRLLICKYAFRTDTAKNVNLYKDSEIRGGYETISRNECVQEILIVLFKIKKYQFGV